MTLYEKYKDYLTGKLFSNSIDFKLSRLKKDKYISRQDFIIELFKDKRVIHVGCVDHLELIEEKLKNKVWLHEKIATSASFTLGIDINKEGIKKMQSLGYNDVYVHDIINESPHPSITERNFKFDYIFLGEILEHVENPTLFLSKIHEKYSNHIKGIVISVPNAFSLSNFKNSLKNMERINSDHKYWFTPYTLSKILVCANFIDIDVRVLKLSDYKKKSFIRNIIRRVLVINFYKRYPLFRDTLVATAKIKILD